MGTDEKLFCRKPTYHRLNLCNQLVMNSVVENVIRSIIQAMIQEPLIKAVIEDELSKSAFTGNMKLSSIRIDRHCDIYLTDYENVKVEIEGFQGKALYLFYLLSPIGVSNRDLPAYHDLLKRIYQEAYKQKANDEYRSEEVTKGMLDRENGVSEANGKIREALKKVVPPEVFKYYIIDGKRDCTRQIAIPKSLITIENEQLIRMADRWKNK